MKKHTVHTFTSEAYPGARQLIYECESRDEFIGSFESTSIEDDFDHGFFYKIADQFYEVAWRNKAGTIQFCGSSAYAMSYYLLSRSPDEIVTFKSKVLDLTAQANHGKVTLKFPAKDVISFGEFETQRVFLNPTSGIYIIHLEDSKLIENNSFVNRFIHDNSIENKHGLCIFCVDQQSTTGQLRYFTPWHGRNEDYVTGSIHQYLGPLTNTLFGLKSIKWTQRSSSPGILFSELKEKTVEISGQCHLSEI